MSDSQVRPSPDLEEEEEPDVPPEYECAICLKLLLDAVSTSCGHNFCHGCLHRSLDIRSQCPLCRTPLSGIPPPNRLLASMISDRFPELTVWRRKEEAEARKAAEAESWRLRASEAGGESLLPLFSFSGAPLLFPGEKCPFFIYEPQYLEMVEHSLQGDRRIALVEPSLLPVGGEEAGGRFQGVCLELVEVFPHSQGKHIISKTLHRIQITEGPIQGENRPYSLLRAAPVFDRALSSQVAQSSALPSEGLNRSAETEGGEGVRVRLGRDGERETTEDTAIPNGIRPPSSSDSSSSSATQAAIDLQRETAGMDELSQARVMWTRAQAQLQKLKRSLGHSGMQIFDMTHGAAPTIAPNGGSSADFEKASFWLAKVLRLSRSERLQFSSCTNTVERLRGLLQILEGARSGAVVLRMSNSSVVST